jgi:hypothetical protein
LKAWEGWGQGKGQEAEGTKLKVGKFSWEAKPWEVSIEWRLMG